MRPDWRKSLTRKNFRLLTRQATHIRGLKRNPAQLSIFPQNPLIGDFLDLDFYTMILYRKSKAAADLEWHFHSQCPRWPLTSFFQVRFLLMNRHEQDRICPDCINLEAQLVPLEMPHQRQQHTTATIRGLSFCARFRVRSVAPCCCSAQKRLSPTAARLGFFRRCKLWFSKPADFKPFRQRRRYELERVHAIAFVPDSLL